MFNIGIVDGFNKLKNGFLNLPDIPVKDPELENRLVEEAAACTRTMIESLSMKEIQQVGFVPLVITELAWIYAQQARDAAARNKLEMFRKLGKIFDEQRKEYDNYLSLNLDYIRRKTIKVEAESLIRDYEKDFTILSICCNQELKRVAPEYYYEDVRTPAIVSIELVGLVGAINKLNDTLLAKRLKGRLIEKTQMNPYTAWLGDNMECYAGVDTKTYNYGNKDILNAIAVIRNRAIIRDYHILNQ